MGKRSAAAAIALNFFFLPMGYLYLKANGRFIAGALFSVFMTIFFSFLLWLFPRFLPAVITAPLTIIVSLGITTLIIIDSFRLSRMPQPSKYWPVFAKPHVFWFIPVYLIAVVAIAIISEPIEKPFAKPHNIPSPAMEPNVQVGDFVFADYMINKSQLKRSDIVIHEGIGSYKGKRLIKRIIGLPGERVRLFEERVFGKDGTEYHVTRYAINGRTIPLIFRGNSDNKYKLQKYSKLSNLGVFTEKPEGTGYDILEEERPFDFPEGRRTDFELGPDEFFLLGDNRDHALDSRHDGPVHRSQILGKYMHTYFSFFIEDASCEMTHPVLFVIKAMSANSGHPCNGVTIRWEKAGYTAR
ncbi:MAG: signal peptidase I [Leptospiraceae bacterium]|nr:signal peptidase I [Leptospiraceae bacterium]